jgi:hypothetical protein
MAGGRFLTTCTPKYGEIVKVIAPFGTTLDCDMWRGALGTRQMAQSSVLTEAYHITGYRLKWSYFRQNRDIFHLNSKKLTISYRDA